MPYTGLLSWHIKETAGQFYSKPRDRKCKLDYLIKYMTILVENVKCSVCKNKAGGLFPSSEFSHEALEIQHSASTRSRELRFNCGSVINVSALYSLPCNPIHEHSLPWNSEMPSSPWLWDLAHRMLANITGRTEMCSLSWAHLPLTWEDLTWVTHGVQWADRRCVEQVCELTEAELSRAAGQAQPGSTNLQTPKQKKCFLHSPQILQLLRSIPVATVHWSITGDCVTLGHPLPAYPPPVLHKVRGGVRGSIQSLLIVAGDKKPGRKRAADSRCSDFFRPRRRSWGKRSHWHCRQEAKPLSQWFATNVRPRVHSDLRKSTVGGGSDKPVCQHLSMASSQIKLAFLLAET